MTIDQKQTSQVSTAKMSAVMLRTQRMAIATVRRAARYQSTVSSGSTSAGPGTSIQTTDLLEYYRGLVARGDLRWDDEQVRCVMHVRSKSFSCSQRLMDEAQEAVGHSGRLPTAIGING